MIAKWLSECWEAARSCCAIRPHFLLHRLNSPPLPSLLSSPLCSPLPAVVWSFPLFAVTAHLQTILEEDLEDPVYQVTSRTIISLPSPAAFLPSELAALCVHCGETAPVWLQRGNNTTRVRCLYVWNHPLKSVCSRACSCVSVCMSASWGCMISLEMC